MKKTTLYNLLSIVYVLLLLLVSLIPISSFGFGEGMFATFFFKQLFMVFLSYLYSIFFIILLTQVENKTSEKVFGIIISIILPGIIPLLLYLFKYRKRLKQTEQIS